MLHLIFTVLAAALALGGYVPYGWDVLQGKVKPARSTRLMFVLILTLALLQQRSLGATLTLVLTIGELIGSVVILVLSLPYGMGGLRWLDIMCYILVALDIALWLATKNAFWALCLSATADTIAFFPVLHKTWQDPQSETPTFYVLGALAPLLTLAGAQHLNYAIALYPLTLAIANGLELLLIWRYRPK